MFYYKGRWVAEVDPKDVYRLSWGKCPSYGASVNLGVSRMCPLGYAIGELFEMTLTPTFGCGDWNKGTCPLAKIQDAALEMAINM